jgi:hypothetical protein
VLGSDARALRAGLESFAREHHAGLDQLLVEPPHRGEELLVGEDSGFGLLVGLDQDHESHRRRSFGSAAGLPQVDHETAVKW